ncbi:MAG TPA: formate dehydrogenase accessory sulfurtransferase FdhD [Candidatus Binatia bacterium]|jgi:FdhD protein
MKAGMIDPAIPQPEGDDVSTRSALRRAIAPGRSLSSSDVVAREEPLEIQLGPASLAVVMRTPGHDEELVRGFAITERIVASASQILSVRHCSTARSAEAEDNVVRILVAAEVEVDLAALRRNLYASSSCGICGKATIENALATAPPLADDAFALDAATIRAFPAKLASMQEGFRATGGLHAAGLFDRSGNLLVVREDIGRHNAVDKVVGWAAAHGLLPLSRHALMVSGRISFEIVQKALAARVPVVAAVSAPSSLAIELAEASGIALVGFLRGQTMNVYANQARVLA